MELPGSFMKLSPLSPGEEVRTAKEYNGEIQDFSRAVIEQQCLSLPLLSSPPKKVAAKIYLQALSQVFKHNFEILLF